MKRAALLCTFAICVFAVGIAAGNHLRQFLHRTPAISIQEATGESSRRSVADEAAAVGILQRSESARSSEFRQATIPDTELDTELDTDPDIAGIDLSEQATFISQVREIAASGPAASFDPAEEHAAAQAVTAEVASTAFNPAKRASIVRMILQFLPDLTKAEIDVWAEQLLELSADEAFFVLQQKQRSQRVGSSTTLPKSLTGSIDQILSGADVMSVQRSDLSSPVELISAEHHNSATGHVAPDELSIAMKVVRSNLRGTHTPGFRGQRIILDAMIEHAALTAAADPASYAIKTCKTTAEVFPRSLQLTTMTRFECAASEFSGNPLHVALPDDPHLMFQIQQPQDPSAANSETRLLFTRRGTFSLLHSGKLGLQIGSVQLPLVPEIQIPKGSSGIWITAIAEVRCLTEDQQEVCCGRLAVVQIPALSELRTTDGLLFSLSHSEQPVPVDPQNLALRIESFELSNIDELREWSMLQHFQRLAEQAGGHPMPLSESTPGFDELHLRQTLPRLQGVSRATPANPGD